MAHANGTGEICPSSTVSPPTPKFNVPPDGPRHRVLTRLRAWERGWQKGRGRWAKLYADSISGAMYLDRLTAGRVHPYALGDVGHALMQVLSRDAVDMLQHLVAAQKAFGARGGLRISHATTAGILRRSPRHAGDVMRELVASGLIEVRWHFKKLSEAERVASYDRGTKRTRKHHERTPCYSTTARCAEVIARCLGRSSKYVVGKKDQPSRIQPVRTSGPKRKSSGRPEQDYVAQLLKSRGPRREPAAVATVIERKPDGTVAMGSPLTAAAVAQRLRTGRDDDHGQLDAWKSFEAHLARGGAGA